MKCIFIYSREPYEPKPILGATITMLSGKSMAMDVVRIQQQNQVLS